MDAFSYVDIFSTKGIEYLIVIGFLLVIAPVWLMLTKPVKSKVDLLKSAQGLSARILQIPKGLLYSRNHTWTIMEKSGAVKMGADDLLLHLTGGVSVDYLKTKGDKVSKGEVVARFVQEGKEMTLKSPLSGELAKVNESLTMRKGMINSDPYGKGWMMKIEPEDWKNEMSDLMMAEEAESWAGEELLKCKDFVASVVKEETGEEVDVLQAGGELVDFPLEELSGDSWRKFQEEFLD